MAGSMPMDNMVVITLATRLVVAISFSCVCADAAWWALGTRSLAAGGDNLGRQSAICNEFGALNKQQRSICHKYPDLLASVSEGARKSIEECKHQFKYRRWNCSLTPSSNSVFGPILRKATRETAFIHAITAAGVGHAVTEACAQGTSKHCSCDRSYLGKGGGPGDNWKWGGCSRDLIFGRNFSEWFVDAADNRGRSPMRDMSRHNNRAGREAIVSQIWRKCKCHGLSGSCNMKTCWIEQPTFRQVGDWLRAKYDRAHEMIIAYKRDKSGRVKYKRLKPKYKHFVRPTKRDLIYFERSPDFCVSNRTAGTAGTSGRECNITSSGVDGCELMCCRRGYKVRTVAVTTSCNCKFVWCCKVQCESCQDMKTVYTCK